MTTRSSDPTGPELAPTARKRRLPWWAAALLLLTILLIILVIWLFGPRIRTALAPAPTLPPEIGEAAEGQDGILYSTGFDAEADFADWELFDDGVISAVQGAGQLVVGVNALSDTGTWSGLNYTFTDFVLEVDATKLDGPDDNSIIVVFRLTDTQNYYRFDVSSDGFYALSKVRDGVPERVSEYIFSPAIRTGAATNHLTVSAQGQAFRFAVNDTLLRFCVNPDPAVFPVWADPANPESECLGGEIVETWSDPDLPRGKIGLGAQGFTGFDGENTTPALAVIGFDNLVITAPGQ